MFTSAFVYKHRIEPGERTILDTANEYRARRGRMNARDWLRVSNMLSRFDPYKPIRFSDLWHLSVRTYSGAVVIFYGMKPTCFSANVHQALDQFSVELDENWP